MSELKGTNIAAPIVPFTDEDVYSTHDSIYGKGGYREVSTLSERDMIPIDRLRNGCKVYVEETDTEYRYRKGIWIPLTPLLYSITTQEEYDSMSIKNQHTLYMCKEEDSITKLYIGSIPIFAGGDNPNTPVTFLLDSGILDRDTLGTYDDGVVLVLDSSKLDQSKLI